MIPVQETQVMQIRSLGWEDLLEEEMQPIPIFLPEKSLGQRRLANHSSKKHKETYHMDRKMSVSYEIHLEIERPHWYSTTTHLDSFKNYYLKMPPLNNNHMFI